MFQVHSVLTQKVRLTCLCLSRAIIPWRNQPIARPCYLVRFRDWREVMRVNKKSDEHGSHLPFVSVDFLVFTREKVEVPLHQWWTALLQWLPCNKRIPTVLFMGVSGVLALSMEKNVMETHLGQRNGINPLRPNNDLNQTSHCNIKGVSVSEVMRIENMIAQVKFYWYFNSFSPLLL